jgi:hypothetical protein
MRIRIVTRPESKSIDDIRLDYFELGHVYDVGASLACLMLAEGWAEPAPVEEPTPPVKLPKTNLTKRANLITERQSLTDRRPAVAAHRPRRRPRRPKNRDQ